MKVFNKEIYLTILAQIVAPGIKRKYIIVCHSLEMGVKALFGSKFSTVRVMVVKLVRFHLSVDVVLVRVRIVPFNGVDKTTRC